jgi:lipopolysaccharide export system protein LptA
MRSLRWLLLLAMIGIAVAVAVIYRTSFFKARANRRATPPALGLDLAGDAYEYEWSQNGSTHVKVRAKYMTRSADDSRISLKEVELQIFAKGDKKYERVRAPEAVLTVSDHKLYAPGEAEITLDVPAHGDPPHPLTSIKAAGVNFDSQSGKAITDKHVSFSFDGGSGTSEGASYDPDTHALMLNSAVVVNLKGKNANSLPMKVEAGQLNYNEKDGLVHLGPWSRMTRADTIINAGESTVKLLDKKMDTVDAVNAKGSDKRPGREVEYQADTIHIHYIDGAADKITGTGNAKLVSHGKGSDTTMTGNVVDLFFNTESGDSELSSAIAHGNGAVESKPTPDPKGATPDTKILRADTLDLHMRPGGKDLSRVHTQTPGTLEFVPNQIARHRRILKANEMDVLYGDKNEIQSFHATAASTETYPSEEERRRKTPKTDVGYTSSKVIDATFDEKGQLKTMKQTDDFHYTEGPRKAQADFATLDNAKNVMDLVNHARINDDAGTTIADRIELQQSTGDFDARGHVSTTRLPDQKKSSSDMLDRDEATQGMADRVISANRNKEIHYIGNAVLWQSANRIQADKIDVDRDKKSIVADGQVVSQFKDKDKEKDDKAPKVAEKAKPSADQPIFTIVKAPHMVYTDQDRLAVYTGGTDFWRSKLTVKSTTLRAWLNPDNSDSDSRINHAFADGKVEIVQISPDRKRIGDSEHAEYYADDGKVVLTEGEPKLNDSLKGSTAADKLTYFTDDDRLIVEGSPKKQVKTHLLKKKKP